MTLKYIAQDAKGDPLHIRREVSRAEFTETIQDLLDRTITSIDQALKDPDSRLATLIASSSSHRRVFRRYRNRSRPGWSKTRT